jgi:tetratricopeptide (TPR) repeat protein
MKKTILIRFPLVTAGLLLLLAPKSFAYTAADYYNAGLQLYNSKNYPQAIQYFSAAISLDPHNTSALQGRANCYYVQGQYQQALDDYQKVQALTPSDQLARLIQALQTKLGASPAGGMAAPPTAAAPASPFAQGVALYQQKQYQAAMPYFQQAVRENPNDAKAYYYLGLTQYMAGDLKDACVNLTFSDQKEPNPSLRAFVGQLRAKLSPEDRQWVDSQVGVTARVNQFKLKRTKEGRVMASLAFLNLSDFMTNAQTNQTATRYYQSVNPNLGYTGSLPTGSADIGIEGDYCLSPEFELGLNVGILPIGTAADNITDNASVTVTDSFNIIAATVGIDFRYLIVKGDIQPWVAGGPLIIPSTINYNFQDNQSAGSVTFNGPFSSLGFGGEGQVGVDVHIGDAFVLSVFGGYQFGGSNHFTGTMGSTNIPGVSSGDTVQLMVVPTAQGNVIAPVSNGLLMIPTYSNNVGAAAPPGTRPLNLDISGPTAGFMLGYYFF